MVKYSVKVHFPDLKKIKKICPQNAYKCLNIHLKQTYFCHMGGSVTDSGLPTTPHMHYVGSTMLHVSRTPHCVSHTAHCVGHTAQFVGRTAQCVSHTEY